MASWLWHRIGVLVIRCFCIDPMHHDFALSKSYTSYIAATRLWHRSNGLFWTKRVKTWLYECEVMPEITNCGSTAVASCVELILCFLWWCKIVLRGLTCVL